VAEGSRGINVSHAGGFSPPSDSAHRLLQEPPAKNRFLAVTTPLFHRLDAITGKPLWIHRLGQRVEETTLCIYQNKVIVLAGDGYVHALE
jgi:hypothetical protein